MTGPALKTRDVRARILRDVREAKPSAASRSLAAAHLEASHDALHTLRVRQLVAACRGVGDWHLRKLLAQARVDGDRRVGRLTQRERDALVDVLTERWPHETAAAA